MALRITLLAVCLGTFSALRNRNSQVHHTHHRASSPQAPEAPRNVHCANSQASPGLLQASCEVDPSKIDMVSFAVARADDPERWFFIHQSVIVDESSNGIIHSGIPNLQPAVKYLLMARSHQRGQTTGWYVMWSSATHFDGTCEIETDVAHKSVDLKIVHSTTRTRWIDVYRHNGNNYWSTPDPSNNITLPDYLSAHNAADLAGEFGSLALATYAPEEVNSSFAKYCVEIADVELPNITTVTGMEGKEVTSHFADYLSCAGGRCFCSPYGDRKMRQPHEILQRYCPQCYPNGEDACECSCPQSVMDAAEKYVGMLKFSVQSLSGSRPGEWYSLPPAGECALGAQVGDNGCTWRVAPISYTFSLETGYKQGIFTKPWASWLPMAIRYGLGGRGYPEKAADYYHQLGALPCGL